MFLTRLRFCWLYFIHLCYTSMSSEVAENQLVHSTNPEFLSFIFIEYLLYSSLHLEEQASDGAFKAQILNSQQKQMGLCATWTQTRSDFPAHCDYCFTSRRDRLISSSQGDRRGSERKRQSKRVRMNGGVRENISG